MEYKGKKKIQFDLNREYGIVLEGGGARGAYQIGAWKALREAGVKIKGVSGTSVGALNGAMICMDDFDVAEEIWSNMSYSQVMEVQEDWIEGIIKGDILNNNLADTIKTAFKHLKEGGFDTTPLRKLLDEKLSPQRIKGSDIDFFFEVFSLENLKEISVDAKQIPDEDMTDMLLASAHLPVFKKEEGPGRKLIDGGIINNVPIDALIERGYEDIICIRIYGIGVEKRVEIPDNVNIYEIAPRIGLGGILEFDKRRSRRNMKAGYYDALRFLYGFGGRIYYIDEACKEYECLCEFASLPFAMWKYNERAMRKKENSDNEQVHEQEPAEPEVLSYRDVVEKILPQTAFELRLSREWDYKELYLAMLEATAKLLRIPKYCIYTLEEFKMQILERWQRSGGEKENTPDFVKYTVALCMLE